MAKALSFADVLRAMEQRRGIIGRKLVASMIETGMFFEDTTRGRIIFAGNNATPERLSRIISDCFVEMLAIVFEEERPDQILRLRGGKLELGPPDEPAEPD